MIKYIANTIVVFLRKFRLVNTDIRAYVIQSFLERALPGILCLGLLAAIITALCL